MWKPGELETWSIQEVLEFIKTGMYQGDDLRMATIAVRNISQHEQQNIQKLGTLPVALFNGVFSYKNGNGCQEYSCYTALDFDRLKCEEELQQLRENLSKVECVYAVWRTPSGKGLKAIVLHDNKYPEYHKEMYNTLLQYFNLEYLDTKTGDLARGSFLCYDPNIWINNSCKPFHFEHNPLSTTPETTGGNTQNIDLQTLRNTLATIPVDKNKHSDPFIWEILFQHWRKDPSRWKPGNRANSVFNSALNLCLLGIDIDNALHYLQRVYTKTGLEKEEIQYQTIRGYLVNLDKFGTTRHTFDKYTTGRT